MVPFSPCFLHWQLFVFSEKEEFAGNELYFFSPPQPQPIRGEPNSMFFQNFIDSKKSL